MRLSAEEEKRIWEDASDEEWLSHSWKCLCRACAILKLLAELSAVREELKQAREAIEEYREENHEMHAACRTLQAAEVRATEAERQLAHERVLFSNFLHDVSEGFECLPMCDSYGHEELCPVANPLPAWRQLRTENAALTERIDNLKQDCEEAEAKVYGLEQHLEAENAALKARLGAHPTLCGEWCASLKHEGQ